VPARVLRRRRPRPGLAVRGGVGWYPQSHFIHVDSGPVRNWTLDERGLQNLLSDPVGIREAQLRGPSPGRRGGKPPAADDTTATLSQYRTDAVSDDAIRPSQFTPSGTKEGSIRPSQYSSGS